MPCLKSLKIVNHTAILVGRDLYPETSSRIRSGFPLQFLPHKSVVRDFHYNPSRKKSKTISVRNI